MPSIWADGSAADRLCAFDGTESPIAESSTDNWARHDLIIVPLEKTGLKWDQHFSGDGCTFAKESVSKAQAWRAGILRKNPNAIILAAYNAFEAPVDYLPLGSIYWRRTRQGGLDSLMTDKGILARLKFDRPTFQGHVQRQIAIMMQSHVIDGVMMRSWTQDSPAHLSLVQAVRRGVGKSGVVLLDTGTNIPALCGGYINGIVVTDDGKGRPIWPSFGGLASWVHDNVRKPEMMVLRAVAPHERNRLYDMRMMTTLALMHFAPYVEFEDATGHDWYDFWHADLGAADGPAYAKDGAVWREFRHGTVVFNPPTNKSIVVDFPSQRSSQAKSVAGRRFSIQTGDGDIFLGKPSSDAGQSKR